MKYTKDQLRAMAQSVLWRKEHDPASVSEFITVLRMRANITQWHAWANIQELANG